MNNIEDISFDKFRNLTMKCTESLVLLGAGGDPNEWIDGVADLLLKENIAKGPKHTMFGPTFYKMTTNGGRTDLALTISDKTTLDIGKLAVWRIKFGNCSWGSDYIVNYRNHHK